MLKWVDITSGPFITLEMEGQDKCIVGDSMPCGVFCCILHILINIIGFHSGIIMCIQKIHILCTADIQNIEKVVFANRGHCSPFFVLYGAE